MNTTRFVFRHAAAVERSGPNFSAKSTPISGPTSSGRWISTTLRPERASNLGNRPNCDLKSTTIPKSTTNLLTLYVRQPAYDSTILERMDRVWLPFVEQLSEASGDPLINNQ